MKRRQFLASTGGLFAAAAALDSKSESLHARPPGACYEHTTTTDPKSLSTGRNSEAGHVFNGSYDGEYLEHIAFPLGGMGAGMACLEGTGALSHVSLRHRPDLAREPGMFAALSIKGRAPVARVLEGPVPRRKRRPNFSRKNFTGGVAAWWGLPRFRSASFTARFPFAEVAMFDEAVPLEVKLTGWSPFEPNDADDASLPVAGLEYEFTNVGSTAVEAVLSFHAANFMADNLAAKETLDKVKDMPGGFQLYGAGAPKRPWEAGTFAAWVDDPAVQVNAAWPSLGGAFLTSLSGVNLAWADVQSGACYSRREVTEGAAAPGASLFVPFTLAAGERKTIALRLAWFVKRSNLSRPGSADGDWLSEDAEPHPEDETYKPWYAERFADIDAVVSYWRENYDLLRRNTARFSQAFYDSTLPPEVVEAVAANLTILKSTTVLRQTDGSLWGWEGSGDDLGLGDGTCTHVWNYAQALAHLFPSLERTLRETEFGPTQREDGHQDFRAAMPIRPTSHNFFAAADGQLGGIIKIYRDWRISAHTTWLRGLWPKVRASLDYCIRTWDPKHKGCLEEPHHNSFDIELWGPDGMCTSVYLGALQAAVLMGRSLNDEVTLYAQLLKKGARRAETELFNGEYFVQKVRWRDLGARFPADASKAYKPFTPEALALADREGPPHQYGEGCLANGVLGDWLALVCGVGQVLRRETVRSHLRAVYRHNLKQDLSAHANPIIFMRAYFAFGNEGGLVLCTWPKGGKLTLPIPWANEVWTGVEYQVASHLMLMGLPEEGLEIVRTCRKRYDGLSRNPFAEVEAGHWYARAMASYGLLQGLSGARYDAVDKILYLKPTIKGDFRCFLSTATGYGTVGVRHGEPFVEVVSGEIPYTRTEYVPALEH